MSSQGLKYSVDLVLCIDATASMGPVLDNVKRHALRFHEDVLARCADKGKTVDSVRVRVIAFRDFYADGGDALKTTEFLSMPDQAGEFSAFVKGLAPSGGGDLPESGLEALALGIKSAWSTSGDRKRQIIVLFTDDAAHPLEMNAGSKPSSYPSGLPKDFSDLTDLYDGQGSPMSPNAKRLIVFAPDATPWSEIVTHWENVVHYASKAGEGIADHDYEQIVDVVASSV